ncbi:hypothetical protein STEG23_013965 [Scotinomys teguina]
MAKSVDSGVIGTVDGVPCCGPKSKETSQASETRRNLPSFKLFFQLSCHSIEKVTNEHPRGFNSQNRGLVHFILFTAKPGDRDCFSFSAFSLSVMTRVQRFMETS